jgi:hypothetical protein
MNEAIRQQLLKLDVNGDGKVTVGDAHELLERELAGKKPTAVAYGGFIAGLVIGFVAGRASK